MVKRLGAVVVLAWAAFSSQPALAAATFPCFGAPPAYVAHYDGSSQDLDGAVDGAVSFAEPRVFLESQGWWVENGEPDPLSSEHIHVGLCYPQGERIRLQNGRVRWPLMMQLHNQIGATSNFVRGGGFQDGAVTPRANWDPSWDPVSDQEVRFAVLTKRRRNLTRCGRREARFTNNVPVSVHAHRFYQSAGWQTYVPCLRGLRRTNYRSSDLMIARGYYESFDYVNVSLQGNWRASAMASTPVPDAWTVRVGTGAGSTSYAVYVDPDLHHGSKGIVVAEGLGGDATRSVTIDTSQLTPGIHKLMVVANETQLDPLRPIRGTASGVLVVPFLVGGDAYLSASRLRSSDFYCGSNARSTPASGALIGRRTAGTRPLRPAS
jgi:hypothetical protein